MKTSMATTTKCYEQKIKKIINFSKNKLLLKQEQILRIAAFQYKSIHKKKQ